MTISRRSAITVLGASAFVIVTRAAVAQTLRPTPQETFGPYFPVGATQTSDFDLTRVAGRSDRALGQVIEISGRVRRIDGSSVSGASMLIWQANAAGRYTHPMDKSTAPLDPNFHGITMLRTASDGRYHLRTVKPGAYPDPAGGMRTPHIHFDVTATDYRLVAQMYFPDEPLNSKDILMSTMAARARDPALTICKAMASTESGVLKFEWDIVLLQA